MAVYALFAKRPAAVLTVTAMLTVGAFGTAAHVQKQSRTPHPLADLFHTANARLAQYATDTLINPLVALPGVDLRKAHNALRLISISAPLSVVHYPQEEDMLRAFLKSMNIRHTLVTEKKRRAFVQSPSYLRAFLYHRALLRSLFVLRTEAERQSALLETYRRPTYLQYVNGVSSTKHTAAALKILAAQYEALATEERARFHCVFAACDNAQRTPSASARLPVAQKIQEKIGSDVRAYEQAAIAYAHTRESIGRVATTTPRNMLIPVIFLNSHCTGHNNAFASWREVPTRSGVAEAASMSLADDLWFNDTTDSPSDYMRHLHALGAPYVYQNLNPYLCADYALDMTRVLTGWYIVDALPVLSSLSEMPETQKAALEIASLYAQERVLFDYDIESLQAAIAQELTPSYLARIETRTGSEGAQDIAEILTAIRAQTGYFELLLGSIDDMLMGAPFILTHQPIPLELFLLMRTYPSIFFLVFNSTVTDEKVSFLFETFPLHVERVRMLSHKKSLENVMPLKTLPETFRDFKRKTKGFYEDSRIERW